MLFFFITVSLKVGICSAEHSNQQTKETNKRKISKQKQHTIGTFYPHIRLFFSTSLGLFSVAETSVVFGFLFVFVILLSCTDKGNAVAAISNVSFFACVYLCYFFVFVRRM